MICLEIAQYLHDNNHGVYDTVGTTGTIFIHGIPMEPVELISLYQRVSEDSDTRNEYLVPHVQAIVRDRNFVNVMTRGQEIIKSLNGFTNGPLIAGGKHVISVLALQSSPISLGKDDGGNWEVSLNFRVEYKE